MLNHLGFDSLYSQKKLSVEQAFNLVRKGNLRLIFMQKTKYYECFEVNIYMCCIIININFFFNLLFFMKMEKQLLFIK